MTGRPVGDTATVRRSADAPAPEVIEAVPDGIVIVDGRGTIVFVNRQTETMLGYDRSELLGRPVEVLVPGDRAQRHRAERAGFLAAPHQRPMGIGMHLEARRRDGTTLPVDIALSPLRDAGGSARVIAAMRDVSERLRFEAELHDARASMATLAERERIARDLHDTVVQHLFAVGMSLQATESQVTDPAVQRRIQWAVDHLDDTIRDVRSAIFSLQRTPNAGGLRARLRDLMVEASAALGFEPRLRVDGLVDAGVDPGVAEHVLAVVREALSNVARHARASTCDVEVSVTGALVTVVVGDDGVGIDDDAGDAPRGVARGNGLRNVAARAAVLGGVCEVQRRGLRGTVVRWVVPAGAATDGEPG